jgi:hypothetical protein
MSTANFVQVDATEQHGTALIAKDDSVWVVLAPRAWDIATWLWWWLAPSDRKRWVTLNATDGGKIRARSIRVARRHVRIRGNV